MAKGGGRSSAGGSKGTGGAVTRPIGPATRPRGGIKTTGFKPLGQSKGGVAPIRQTVPLKPVSTKGYGVQGK